MGGENQITSVDDIAHDDQELKRKAEELTNGKVTLDRDETVGKNFEVVDSIVCAILVKKNSARGAVRVTAPGMPNVVTGPDRSGFDIVVIRPGQVCMFYLTPTVRYFRRA